MECYKNVKQFGKVYVVYFHANIIKIIIPGGDDIPCYVLRLCYIYAMLYITF